MNLHVVSLGGIQQCLYYSIHLTFIFEGIKQDPVIGDLFLIVDIVDGDPFALNLGVIVLNLWRIQQFGLDLNGLLRDHENDVFLHQVVQPLPHFPVFDVWILDRYFSESRHDTSVGLHFFT